MQARNTAKLNCKKLNQCLNKQNLQAIAHKDMYYAVKLFQTLKQVTEASIKSPTGGYNHN
jgi:hypothetical protein